jgi:predicted nucleic acid-binding protein
MIFIDANIFMYAVGKPHPHKAASETLVRKAARSSRRDSYCTNTEVLQEILHRYISLGMKEIALDIAEGILSLGITILPVQKDDLRRTTKILREFKNLSVRDALHLGVMQTHGITEVATYDRAFKEIPWVKIVSLE